MPCANPPFIPPTVAQFQAQFYRDFPYPADPTSTAGVNPTDIQNAINMAGINFNTGVWPTQAVFWSMWNLLAAHYLVTNLLNSSQGLAGQFSWLTTHKNVDSVQESFSVPDFVHDNAEWAAVSKTRYGAQYITFLMPYVRGTMFASYDPAHAGS